MIADPHVAEFLAAAELAFGRDQGEGSLAGIGFADMLSASSSDRSARDALFAVFRAHGRKLGHTSALFQLLAAPFALGGGLPAALVLASDDAGETVATPSGYAGDVVVDLGARGVFVTDATTLLRVSTAVIDADLIEVRRGTIRGTPVIDGADAEPARRGAEAWGSLAIAFEVLGAAESLLGLGVEHARDRVQFGAPIASFQAVRHLLAWTSLDVQACEHLCHAAACALPDERVAMAAIAKAVSGRNGRRVADRIAQVLGGIGFTWEHPFHRFHRRILVLDSMLGRSSETMTDVGRSFGTSDPARVLPLASLCAG